MVSQPKDDIPEFTLLVQRRVCVCVQVLVTKKRGFFLGVFEGRPNSIAPWCDSDGACIVNWAE